jgi:Uri superfamily endonuclease
MTSRPGTYALVLECKTDARLRVGRLGPLHLQAGSYVYVGSAFGTGGLAARIRHHQRIAARPHWHIDYLRAVCELVEVWFTDDPARREPVWARAMAGLPGASVPLAGFGSSDCDCAAHLFTFNRVPSIRAFRQRVKAACPAHGQISSWRVSGSRL